MNALLTTVIIVWAVGAWVSLFIVVPRCATSLCRDRLWQLRDTLADEIRQGKYTNVEAAEYFRSLVETSIDRANQLTVLDAVLMRASVPKHVLGEDLFRDYHLTPPDMSRLAGHQDGWRSIIQRKVVLGSPSGWCFLLLAAPVALVGAIVSRFRDKSRGGSSRGGSLIDDAKEHAKQHVPVEVELNPAARVLAGVTGRPRDSVH